MLDFDYVCERKRPSVAAMVYPFRYVSLSLLNFENIENSGLFFIFCNSKCCHSYSKDT